MKNELYNRHAEGAAFQQLQATISSSYINIVLQYYLIRKNQKVELMALGLVALLLILISGQFAAALVPAQDPGLCLLWIKGQHPPYPSEPHSNCLRACYNQLKNCTCNGGTAFERCNRCVEACFKWRTTCKKGGHNCAKPLIASPVLYYVLNAYRIKWIAKSCVTFCQCVPVPPLLIKIINIEHITV